MTKMRQSIATSLLCLLGGASLVLGACENYSFTTCDDGIVHWYDLNDGQICDPKDCGGGRAPPRTDVPGCPLYSGTILSEPISYLSCFTPSNAVPVTTSTSASAGSAETTSTDVVITSAISTSTSDAGRTTQEPASETSTVDSSVASGKPSTLFTTTASSHASASTKTPITSPATLSTKSQATHAASNTTSGSASTTSTTNAGNAMGGSLLAVVGVAIGAFALL
ncbi:hypothetical protein MKX07_008226 [Trichoderma sp. CBMAI-0711]|uniref:HFB protein n=1 Tax=Trichoderma parareesei TaxID=858221 RepID=A0A2H2ZJE6_TRIPA|nr:hypothetical protein MKX07_008226 [Trichoderma sp. CBMAI-0711]OTA04812.1 hypothetical protein A9Z42_0054060 [Trichoderma parareesei]